MIFLSRQADRVMLVFNVYFLGQLFLGTALSLFRGGSI